MALIEERYNNLTKDRQPYLDRAEECATATLPYAFPPDDLKGQDNLDRQFTQGYGAMLVKHLVGKLALSILPPSQPFYRFSPTQEAMEAVSKGDENAIFEIEKILGKKEEGALRVINKTNFRGSLYPALILAVVSGNAIVEKTDEGYVVHNLKNFVVKRDYNGTIVELIIRERKDVTTLDAELQSRVAEDKKDEAVDLYTLVERQEGGGGYLMTQELLGEPVGNEITLKEFTDTFLDIGWNRIDGENYRRSFCEDYLGSFISLEKLTKILYEGIAESVKIVKCVNPNGVTTYEDYVDATHGEAIIGNAADITTVQSDKTLDMRVAKELVEEIKQELARAFLVSGASIRDSERTTAQEVQLVASEVEASLGGIYTAIADSIQRPLVLQAMKEVNVEEGKDIDVIITTGIQALGRNVELQKINSTIQELGMLANLVGPEIVAKSINADGFISAIIANSGVASKNFVYSQQQKDEMERAAKEDAMTAQALQVGLPTAGQNIANQMTGGQM